MAAKASWKGHKEANTTEGLKAEWKKAQKNPKKSINSEAKNKINPLYNPLFTTLVWKLKH
jgi:hypothetical protein